MAGARARLVVVVVSVAMVVLAAVVRHAAATGGMGVARTPTGAPLPQAQYEVAVAASGRAAGLPKRFMVNETFPDCLPPVLNQGGCGSCWAFAASEVLSARTCIYAGEKVVLSPQALVSCDDVLKCEMGVLGGRAWHDLTKHGIPTLECVPYVSGDGKVPACPTQCSAPGVAWKTYAAANYTHVGSFIDPASHIAAIKRAIMGGPVDVTFNVFAKFQEYPAGGVVFDGCHLSDGGRFTGMHSVMIVGWDDDMMGHGPAWLVQNSWGEAWPATTPMGVPAGHFWIKAGVDCAGIESMVYAGFPATA
ncbi:peptidase C1A [Thecamonas trahens ATCC 50062]|uniref:Peptidase C1A n=1 Tax=Thecamonas trahens ATCC 50062 TaxID=461836 RepID=A0A0L0DQ91_THETB|nr:peptidase C1A [Thecamonas trahens ATCC 50062]KNC54191.1 peptidase C1A [Thecamonas trahens ATCC 50062]|eukprot:XP_013753832.1 peptidase C1A [Thecamonas trahens ATCC 50062]